MSDVKIAYNGQGRYRDGWERTFTRDGQEVRRRSHKPITEGPNPSPATRQDDMPKASIDGCERIYMVGNPFSNSWFGWVL